MGSVDMYELKQSFVKLVRRVTPPQMPQFVIWLDVKLAEYKLNGYMRLDDDYCAGQTWMELFMGIPSETNGNSVKIKEEPPDTEPGSFNLLIRTGDSRKSSASDPGNNGAQDSDNMEDMSDTQDHIRSADSVSILRSSVQAQTSLYGGKSEYNWHRVENRQPAFPGLISQSASVSNISRPITLMDLKSSANIPTIPSLSAPKGYQSQASSLSALECPLCHKVSKDQRAFRRHMSAHRQPSDYPCNQCGRSFSLKMQLRRHNCSANVRHMQRSPTMSPTHPYASPPARTPYMMSKFKPISVGGQQMSQLSEAGCASVLKLVACEECGRRFSRQQDLSRHVCAKPVTDTPPGGATPNTEVMTLLSLTQLNKNRMSTDYPITCTGCGWSFSRRQDLRRHKCSGDIRKLLNNRESNRTASSESPAPQDTTGSANTESQYDDSAPSSPQPKIKKYEYMCAKCGSNFYTEDELQSHIDKCILEENGANGAHSPKPNTNTQEEETAEVDDKDAEDESADNEEEGENSASNALNYQGSGTTNPTSNTGLWSMNEDSLGASNSASTTQRQSKRKKAVPQKVAVETIVPSSPGPSDPGAVSDDDMDADADVMSPEGGVMGDVIEVDEVISNDVDDQLVLSDTYSQKSPKQRVQKVQSQSQSQGRDSDGDTDEEMFFQVNKEGVITWQGSNLSSTSPASDLGLVSAYQLEQTGSTASLTPAQLDATTDNSTGLLIGQIAGGDAVSAETSTKTLTVQGKSKSIAGKKTTKKRRRNNNGPYECKVCHKLFAQSSSRNRHTKLHYGIYDYACNVCGRQFARREHLKTHANKCPGAGLADTVQQPSKAQSATSIAPATSYSLLQESFGDIIMIQ